MGLLSYFLAKGVLFKDISPFIFKFLGRSSIPVFDSHKLPPIFISFGRYLRFGFSGNENKFLILRPLGSDSIFLFTKIKLSTFNSSLDKGIFLIIFFSICLSLLEDSIDLKSINLSSSSPLSSAYKPGVSEYLPNLGWYFSNILFIKVLNDFGAVP